MHITNERRVNTPWCRCFKLRSIYEMGIRTRNKSLHVLPNLDRTLGGRPTRSNQAQHRPRRPYLIAYASCSLRRRGCLEGCLAAAVAALEAGISGSLKSFRCDATIPSKSAGWHVTVSSLASKDPITLSVHTHEHAHICLCYENA